MVHGDDITSDASGEDCYRFVKAAGRFLVVKRTPGISTTDLVGRMLLCTRNHFIKSLPRTLAGEEGSGSPEERRKTGEEMGQRIKDYATDESGLQPGSQVLSWAGSEAAMEDDISEETGSYSIMVNGTAPQPEQRIVYVDGGFDLFSSGHIEFLRQVQLAEQALARKNGWYDDPGKACSPVYIVAGVHDDEVINHWKGVNYPIMNIFERGLCVVQCRVRKTCSLSRLKADEATVRQRRHLLRSLHAQQSISQEPAVRYSSRRLPRSNVIHAAHV